MRLNYKIELTPGQKQEVSENLMNDPGFQEHIKKNPDYDINREISAMFISELVPVMGSHLQDFSETDVDSSGKNLKLEVDTYVFTPEDIYEITGELVLLAESAADVQVKDKLEEVIGRLLFSPEDENLGDNLEKKCDCENTCDENCKCDCHDRVE